MPSSKPMLHAVPITMGLSSLEGLLECHQVLVAETGGLALVYEKLGPHTYHLKSLDRRIENLPANDQDPKHYFLEVEPCPCHVHSLLSSSCFHLVYFPYYLCFFFVWLWLLFFLTFILFVWYITIFVSGNKCYQLLCSRFWMSMWLKCEETCDTAALGQSCARLFCAWL